MGIKTGGSGSCETFIRICMFIVNIVILLGGLVLLGVGTWTLLDKFYMEELMRNRLYMSATYVMLGVGCASVFLSFAGCFGAYKGHKCVLLTYFVLVFFFFVVLIIAGVFGYVFQHQIDDNLRPEMLHTVELYDPKGRETSAISKAWDATQSNLKCCGISWVGKKKPWKAWKMNLRLNPDSNPDILAVPISCCKQPRNGTLSRCEVNSPGDLELIYQADCFTAGVKFVKSHSVILGGVAIGTACTIVIGMVLSVMLFKMIR